MNLQIKNDPRELGVGAHAYNLNTQESEAGRLKIWAPPALQTSLSYMKDQVSKV